MGKIRVLVAKPGLDGHDRGAKIVARALRDAGMEVIYSGLHQTADQIITTAIQEDVHVIGLSLLSGAHMTLFVDVATLAKKHDLQNVLIIGGGIIPEDDIPALKKAGISAVFGPGTPVEKIVEYIETYVKR
ncbi:MAG: cobalamin B12-binding domain-containing protein [Candidatus Thermoplasmatota archaeon]|nr:cobalamin B12-binding domain-containing protein [Candidatus Thermoplasmatota archaeon]MBU1941006.1 cobalamin B12-binding domain-containing protein [Candidatus Thermoplasmatota archaeon]